MSSQAKADAPKAASTVEPDTPSTARWFAAHNAVVEVLEIFDLLDRLDDGSSWHERWHKHAPPHLSIAHVTLSLLRLSRETELIEKDTNAAVRKLIENATGPLAEKQEAVLENTSLTVLSFTCWNVTGNGLALRPLARTDVIDALSGTTHDDVPTWRSLRQEMLDAHATVVAINQRWRKEGRAGCTALDGPDTSDHCTPAGPEAERGPGRRMRTIADLGDVSSRLLARLRSAKGKPVHVRDLDAAAQLKHGSKNDRKRRERALSELTSGELVEGRLVERCRRGWYRAVIATESDR